MDREKKKVNGSITDNKKMRRDVSTCHYFHLFQPPCQKHPPSTFYENRRQFGVQPHLARPLTNTADDGDGHRCGRSSIPTADASTKMSNSNQNDSLPPLEDCINAIKSVGFDRYSHSSKQLAKLFTSCIGLISHLDQDRWVMPVFAPQKFLNSFSRYYCMYC